MPLRYTTLWFWIIWIILSDVCCLDPRFDPSTRMKLVLIPADATVGSVIYRLRATDEEFDYPLQFELIGDVSSSTVQIESLPCTKYNSVCQANVILRRRLEPGRYYDFQVSVKDTKGGIATQLCSITATNFTTPVDVQFPHKPGIIVIPEDSKRGTELDYVISRKNPLLPKPVYLELWGSPLFAIRQKIVSPETTEGTIFLLGPLDFEKQAMYHLTLLANDAYAEPGQDTRNIAGIEVVVVVQDVQDVPPIFITAPPVTKLPPGLLPGDKILQVHAEDGDKGNPREIQYGLVSEGNPFTSFFRINETTGEIFLAKSLDELSAITHTGDPILLNIIAEEVKVARNEPPAMATTVQIALFLPERTNTPPYFENDHYISRVNENAAQGFALTFAEPYVPRVYDDDSGKNGVFSLTLLNNNGTFEITPNVAERTATFLIKVRDNTLLDYEERHSVQFQILAQELGPATNLSAKVNVTVFINDLNDNPPVFTESMYSVELPENMTAGTKVVQVHAEDVDTGLGGRIRYTQILGYLNTSLHLDAVTGMIVVSTNNHGFDREIMPEYHLYVEARDNDGAGNRVQVPLIIKMIDVNDETPIFEKSIYEFILSTNLKSFTTPAFIKAIDNDATAPNNEIRYEIINGNYQNKFQLHKITGELSVKQQLVLNRRPNQNRQRRQSNQQGSNSDIINEDIFILTARAYDLGVPVRFSTTSIKVYPPESRARTLKFIVPGYNPDRKKIEETLSTITGGQVLIHDVRPLSLDDPEAKNISGGIKDKSLVTATVLYNGNSVIDVANIQQKLMQRNESVAIITNEDQNEALYRAESKLLFWLLILLAVLVATVILILLFCCICPWCPLHNATNKRVINVGTIEDDVHLVHREKANGVQSKSVQVAEWMGRREAWSAEKSPDPQTKPTNWEYSRHIRHDEDVDKHNSIFNKLDKRGVRSADERKIRIKNDVKDLFATKDSRIHNSRTKLINDRDIYMEDIEDRDKFNRSQLKSKYMNTSTTTTKNHHLHHSHHHQRHIDNDSLRRHEIDRDSDNEYDHRDNLKQTDDGRELYIREGNAEILKLMTRGGKHDEENIYVNVPSTKGIAGISQPHLVMLDNSGKEILLRRFIEEQPSGRQIIREQYQVLPGATYVTMPNEVQQQPQQSEVAAYAANADASFRKSGPNSMAYSQMEPEIRVIHSHAAAAEVGTNIDHEMMTQMNIADSTQSLHRELETSLKQQNALLRQILLEKEKLEERYSQQEAALETQSLPCQSMAIGTQTDCEAGTQTDLPYQMKEKRRARSENDDSISEDDYEYITTYASGYDPETLGWIKKRRQKLRAKQLMAQNPRRRVIMVDEVKRKIRTPIKEENEEVNERKKKSTPGKKQQSRNNHPTTQAAETKTSMLRRMKNGIMPSKKSPPKTFVQSPILNKNVLMEISDSLDERTGSPTLKKKRRQKVRVKEIAYEDDSENYSDLNYHKEDDDDDDDADEIIIRRNYTKRSPRKLSSDDDDNEEEEESRHKFEIYLNTGSGERIFSRQRSVEKLGKHYDDETISDTLPIESRLSRKDSRSEKRSHRQSNSEPPMRSTKGPAPKPPAKQYISNKKSSQNLPKAQSEVELADYGDDGSGSIPDNIKSVPRYMDWYYSQKKTTTKTTTGSSSNKKSEKIKTFTSKKLDGDSEKKMKLRQTKYEQHHLQQQQQQQQQQYNQSDLPETYKPEPMPRKSPPNDAKLLKEDRVTNKILKPNIETETNHPLLQHSEHRYECSYDKTPEIPVPPTKLPHYMYPETPPFVSVESQKQFKPSKSTATATSTTTPVTKPIRPSLIKKEKEAALKNTKDSHPPQQPTDTTTNNMFSQGGQSIHQLNVSTLEDDHDSGIAMNSLLNSLRKKHPLTEKKSIFTIAYDEINSIKHAIQSNSN